MKNNRSLSNRCFFLVIILMIQLGVCLLAAATYIFQNGISRTGFQIWVAVQAILFILTIIVARYWLQLPFTKLQNSIRRFVKNKDCINLTSQEYSFCPEWEIATQKINDMLDRKQEFDAVSKRAKILALQNQINPHFLYNTLEAIRSDAIDASVPAIAEIAEALADFFRYTINDVDNILTLEDELNNVENYFLIQHYRFGENLKMKIVWGSDDIQASQIKLPKLTLQPIVENAIFHGLEAKVGGGTITIKVEMTQTKLLISIVDDGVGLEPDMLDQLNERLNNLEAYAHNNDLKRHGIALKNVNNRIKLLYGQNYGIHVYSTKNVGTNVCITLPLIYLND